MAAPFGDEIDIGDRDAGVRRRLTLILPWVQSGRPGKLDGRQQWTKWHLPR